MGKPFLIDLYSGCGGFGLGGKLAGFNCRVAIDIDSTLQSAYKLNFPSTDVIQADIGSLQRQDWSTLIGTDRPDGIIGGPPCQGFSRIGRRQLDDPRNSLVDHFFRHVEMLRPKFFVMENVEGLLDTPNIAILETALQRVTNTYQVLPTITVKASEYGAPTIRKRVIVVGYDPAEISSISKDDLAPDKHNKITTVKDAISDLPEPIKATRKKGDFAWAKYPNQQGKRLSKYAKWARSLPRHGLGWDGSLDKLKSRLVSGFDITVHSQKVASRYAALENGSTDPISRSTRLDWDGLCPTLRAGTGPDKGSYQAVRPIHPQSPRVITVREAARLQGFPDWFSFHHTKWNSFRMIGNSVSPIVSCHILKTIIDKLHVTPNSENTLLPVF